MYSDPERQSPAGTHLPLFDGVTSELSSHVVLALYVNDCQQIVFLTPNLLFGHVELTSVLLK
ncbi:hypothetical protein ES702_02468 [subsurface metagenome]